MGLVALLAATTQTMTAYGSLPNVVINTNDSGPGSLRAAIEFTNTNPGPDTIVFNIPATDPGFAGGVFTIRPTSPLPPVTGSGTVIDGASQTAFTGDSNPRGPEVMLGGSVAGSGNGLTLFSSDNVVANLVISGFPGSGVVIVGTGASGNVVTRSFLGTDASGTGPLGNTGSGIAITGGAHDNVVGPGNVIAFNTKFPSPNAGVAVLDGARQGAYPAFAGLNSEYVGVFPVLSFPNTRGPFTSVDGITPVDGGGHPFADNFGARFTGTLNVPVAGAYTFRFLRPDDLMRVLVDGVVILDVSCCVQSAETSTTLTSGAHAIEVDFFDGPGAAGLTLEIVGPGTVAFTTNGAPGLRGEFFQLRIPTERNRITQNSIFQNGLLGIDLDALEDGFGVNFNDPGDGDMGPNTALNSPAISSVSVSGASVAIAGTIDTSNPGPITIELFSSDVPDPSCSGEGQRFLGAVQALANGSFSATFPASAVGPIVTATATDTVGNTSEFSKAVPCPIVVTNTNDSGPGSLRAAIDRANANPGPDTIVFRIPTIDPGFNGQWFTIKPLSPLPSLSDDGTTADGRSQTAFTGDTNTAGPEIFLDGRSQPDHQAFRIGSSRNVIQGLVMSGFASQAILIRKFPTPEPLTGNVIRGNYIGTDPTGQTAIPNGTHALSVAMGVDTIIGGTAPGDGNLVSGNVAFGIHIVGGSRRTIVQGNRIGTDATGTRALPNREGVNIGEFAGVTFDNVIGGTAAGAANLISGNRGAGVFVSGTGHVIQGNLIGTDITGTRALGNARGLDISGGALAASNNLIGGAGAGEGNVISANGGGVHFEFAENNRLQGNLIGTDVTGTIALGNSFGVFTGTRSTGNLIGGAAAGVRNVVSGNLLVGMKLGGTANVVQGNYVGVDATGERALGNGFGQFAVQPGIGGPGISLVQPFGGQPPATNFMVSGNVISGNAGHGLHIGGSGAKVEGNLVGANAGGTVAIPNGFSGISIDGGTDNVIGGTTATQRNLISGNPQFGIFIGNGSRNTVQGNFIGTDAAGAAAIGNGGAPSQCCGGGIRVQGTSANVLIGGTVAGAGNLISGNKDSGIGAINASGITVEGNLIGTDASGTTAIPNLRTGVRFFENVGDALIGGTAPGAGNLISGNTEFGIAVTGNARDVRIEGNRVGTTRDGSAAIPNGTGRPDCPDCDGGIRVGGGASFVTIGGTAPGAGNLVSGNRGAGIGMIKTTGVVIQGNLIGTDLTGTTAIPNMHGVRTFAAVTAAVIGGTTSAARNLISGNDVGVFFSAGVREGPVTGNRVQGNYIGTDVTGTNALPNRNGIFFMTGPAFSGGDCCLIANNALGGTEPGSGNVVSGNRQTGIVLGHSAANNRIQGNLIGIGSQGTALPNGSSGIFMIAGATQNVIGGDMAGAGNTIAFNDGAGIAVAPFGASQPDRDRISRNSIFSNRGLGIDLGADGVTPNDPGDADVGPNGRQNFAVIGTLDVEGIDLVVTGALDTPNPAAATIEFFGNDVADPSGFGEGQRFAGSVMPSGNGCFRARLPAATVGRFVTSTATDAAGNTSEFSRAVAAATVPAALSLNPATATNTVGDTHTVTVTLTNTAGGPVPCANMTFAVAGANSATGTGTTDISGRATFSYTGVWAGTDAITASSGAVSGTASKTWLFPASTAGSVTGGGQVPTAASSASFGITARDASGQFELKEKGGRNVHSTSIAATVVSGTQATIYGFATVDGTGSVQFRVTVDDQGEPGTNDSFRIVMSDGYAAGGTLQRGNVQVRQ